MTKFMSVGTAAARFQDLSLNPQKLAGQCAKLKCCLNYEVDCYMEANRELPAKDIVLQTADSDYYYFKADTLARTIAYSTSKDGPFNLVTISVDRAREVIDMNKHGQKPETLAAEGDEQRETAPEFADGVGDEALNRFDSARRKKKGNKNRGGERGGERGDRQNRGEKQERGERPQRQDRQDRPDQQPQQQQPQPPRERRPRPQRPNNNNNNRPPRERRGGNNSQ
jgi:hypothetical protein